MDTLNKIGLFIMVIITGALYRRYMDKYELEHDIQDLYIINKELLNHQQKPILWIPVPRYNNARRWSSFYSRNSDDLNIPYMYLTISSIMQRCGDDFAICIIDDNSFEHLLPNWTPELDKIGDPLREKVRYLGMMQLLYHYGGIIIPPSFLCLKNIKPLYNFDTHHHPCIVENVDYYGDSKFAPDPYFIMAHPKCPIIATYVEYLARMTSNDYTAESLFLNDTSKWCAMRCREGKMLMIDGSLVGIKNIKGQPIISDVMFEQNPLGLADNKYGILIPHEQIAKRTALNWFCAIHKNELVKLHTELGSYFAFVEK